MGYLGVSPSNQLSSSPPRTAPSLGDNCHLSSCQAPLDSAGPRFWPIREPVEPTRSPPLFPHTQLSLTKREPANGRGRRGGKGGASPRIVQLPQDRYRRMMASPLQPPTNETEAWGRALLGFSPTDFGMIPTDERRGGARQTAPCDPSSARAALQFAEVPSDSP